MKYPLNFYEKELDYINKKIKRSRSEDTLKRLDIGKKFILSMIKKGKKKENKTKKQIDKLSKMEKKGLI